MSKSDEKVDSVSKVFISFLNCVFKCKFAKRSLPELIEAFTGVGDWVKCGIKRYFLERRTWDQ